MDDALVALISFIAIHGPPGNDAHGVSKSSPNGLAINLISALRPSPPTLLPPEGRGGQKPGYPPLSAPTGKPTQTESC